MVTGGAKGFDDPDDTIQGGGLVSQRLTLGANVVSRSSHSPGWRWSVRARGTGADPWCQTHHVGYALSGSMHIVMRDGSEFDIKAGDVFELPPGHDGWVTSDSPFETLDWVGARSWLADRGRNASILATILFTDVVDSSGEVRRRGNAAWTELNTTLAQRSLDLVVEYGGEVVKSTGDGLLTFFGSTGRAILCGLELVDLAAGLGLAIRVGIHTGEVEPVGHDVHGLSVHEAARVMAAAGPGEVLVSEVTRSLAAASGVVFEDRGSVELKGIGTRQLYLVSTI